MAGPLAYINGELVPAEGLSIPVTDAGFVLGVTVAEQLRTFAGRLFRAQTHFERLSRSLEIVGVDPEVSISTLADVASMLVEHNHKLLDPEDDLALVVFITPGTYPAFAPNATAKPIVCLHTYPIPFCLWAQKYGEGQHVVVTGIEQVSPHSWPAELKCRSRMHYYLGDRKARETDPLARAVLLDRDRFVSEASTANVVAYFESEGLVSPPREKILPGISMAVLAELADRLQIPFRFRDLRPDELVGANELLLSSTSPCLLPVVRVGAHSIAGGRPGPLFGRLIRAWSDMVGVDIIAQAVRFASR